MDDRDKEERLREESHADEEGRTADETADNLLKPGSTATGSGTTGGTTEADVTDGAEQ